MRLKVSASKPVRERLKMLKYVSKFMLDVLPSLLATVIGAYIVNHYIVSKPDAPVAAAVSTADPKADAKAAKAETSDVANIPEPGVRAKGISEKAVLDKSAAEKPAYKTADKPAETASIPSDTRRHQPAAREKTVAKTVPAPQPAVVPVVATPNVVAAPTPPVEAATPAEERRDANDLARAAIERLRGMTDSSPRAPEAARAADTPRVPDAPRVVSAPPVEASRIVPAPSVRPLPPPIMVSTPAGDALDPAAGSSQGKPPSADAARIGAARRRQPIFRSRRRSICVPRRRYRWRGNAGTLPKTCCRRRNRCFTPSCRNNSERIVVLPGLAADARKAALRGFIPGADADGAAIGAGGLGLVAEAFIGEPPGRPDLRVVRVGLRGLVEVGGGFLDLVQREVADRAAQQRLGPLRRQAVRRGKIVDRELMPSFALIEQAATV